LSFADGTARVRDRAGERLVPYGDPLAVLREEIRRYERDEVAGLPRFSGGAVGYVAYEVARRFERLPLAAHDP
ncbi:hypothetical protein WFJ45_22770, partial [Salmonella enterica subsp. enterica serovar Minnesota]